MISLNVFLSTFFVGVNGKLKLTRTHLEASNVAIHCPIEIIDCKYPKVSNLLLPTAITKFWMTMSLYPSPSVYTFIVGFCIVDDFSTFFSINIDFHPFESQITRIFHMNRFGYTSKWKWSAFDKHSTLNETKYCWKELLFKILPKCDKRLHLNQTRLYSHMAIKCTWHRAEYFRSKQKNTKQ